MKTFVTLWRKELSGYFLSPVAYIMIMFFLVIMGLSFWILANVISQQPAEVTVMNELFGSIFFWIAMLVVIPVITMRLFSEEMRSGTIETLLTAPVSDVAIVLAKYAGALSFYVVMWLPTIAYAYILDHYSPLMASIDYGPMLGGYLGAFLVGCFFISVGLFCSSLTQNQIVAAIACFAMIGVAFFTGFIPFITSSPLLEQIGSYTSCVVHMLDFSRGTVDTRPIVFYLSCSIFMIFATVKSVEARRWR